MSVSNIRFVPCRVEQRASGLRGWASCEYSGSLGLNSIAVRRGRDGRALVSFPARFDSNGVERPYVRPLNASVRAEIESAILAHCRRGGFIE